MIAVGALAKWLNQNHPPKTQAIAISFIAKKIDEQETIVGECEDFENGYSERSLHSILLECKQYHTPQVSISTLY